MFNYVTRVPQVQFHTVDILQDDALRQAIKQYGDWPTFPQLYVKGELVGGCDIVTDMLVRSFVTQRDPNVNYQILYVYETKLRSFLTNTITSVSYF